MAEAAEETKPKKSRTTLIIVVLAVILAGGGGAAGAWFLFGGGAKPDGEASASAGEGGGGESHGGDAEGGGAEGHEAAPAAMLNLEAFISNLADPPGDRYIKCTVRIALSSSEAAEKVRTDDLSIVKIRDRILTLVSSKTFGDVSTIEGKDRLREEIAERVTPLLPGGRVTHVYFTEFIVQ